MSVGPAPREPGSCVYAPASGEFDACPCLVPPV